MGNKYFIRTFGCQMNEHDSERIASVLESDGYVHSDSQEDADVVVFNTCCIRENADNKFYGNLGQIKAQRDRNPELKIMVAGCLAQKDRDVIQKRAPWVDVVFGTNNISRATELLKLSNEAGQVIEILDGIESDEVEFASALNAVRASNYQSWVTIQMGCDNNCAFCIVPSVRGKEVSRGFKAIIDEITQLAREGVSEVTLLGQNVNSYGRDIALSLRRDSTLATEIAGPYWHQDRRARPLFADLLREVGAIEGISRVRFTSPHPKDLRSETVAAMAEVPSICEHLHLPLQSGSNRILSIMHRGYSAEKYLEKLEMARHAIQDLAVTTDIIVGFPGETEDDFEQTLEVVAAAEYDSAYTFIFSPRPGTEAAGMVKNYVSEDVVAERFERLKAVVERSAELKHAQRVGRVEEVLVDGPSKKNSRIWSGRTRQNKLVHISVDNSKYADQVPFLPGAYVKVQITSAAAYFLRGEFVELLSMPKRKRILEFTIG